MNQQRCDVTCDNKFNSRFGYQLYVSLAHRYRSRRIGTHDTFAGVDARRARASRMIRVDSLAASLSCRTRPSRAYANPAAGRETGPGRERSFFISSRRSAGSAIFRERYTEERTEECPFAGRESPGDKRVRFLYRQVDCRIGRELQGRKRTERYWREGRRCLIHTRDGERNGERQRERERDREWGNGEGGRSGKSERREEQGG